MPAISKTSNSGDFVYPFIIVLSGIIFALPVILFGFPQGHDSILHVARYRHFADQLWSGELYPRWLAGMNGGLGNPIFFFYGPVPYYVASLFHPFLKDPEGWYQLGLATSLALVASGLAAYFWLRELGSANAALLAAILYMAMPYPLAVDLYRRAALGEYWTFAWMPLILYFARRVAGGHGPALLGLAIAFALLLTTHAIIALVFALLPVVYVCFIADKNSRAKAVLGTVAAMALGVGLAGIYLFPAIAKRSYIAVEEHALQYASHFLFSGSYGSLLRPSFSDLPTFLSQINAVTFGVAWVGFLFAKKNRQPGIRKEGYFWFVTAVVTLCMMLPLSQPVWSTLTFLQAVQHPWRLTAIVTVATAALVALGMVSLERPLKMGATVWLAVAVLLIFTWLLPTVRVVGRRYEPSQLAAGARLSIELGVEDAGMRPKWVERQTLDPKVLKEIVTGRAVKAGIGVDPNSISVARPKSREIVLEMNLPQDTWLVINQFYFPGWTAHLMGEPLPLPLRPSKQLGLIDLWVPGGAHKVVLRLEGGRVERVGQVASILSLAFILSWAFWFQFSRAKAQR